MHSFLHFKLSVYTGTLRTEPYRSCYRHEASASHNKCVGVMYVAVVRVTDIAIIINFVKRLGCTKGHSCKRTHRPHKQIHTYN